MDLSYVLHNDDKVLMAVFLILVLMSIITWVVIIIRTVKLFLANKANKQFIQVFWRSDNISSAVSDVQNIKAPMTVLASDSFTAKQEYNQQKYSHLHDAVPFNEYIMRHIAFALNKTLRPFDRGLTALASIGATAPFVGLFGTVWGIYNALINISTAGQVTLAVVSAPIGEALIATAFGLFVAIPAVLAYNALVRSNKNLANDMDNFAHDLHVQLLNDNDSKS